MILKCGPHKNLQLYLNDLKCRIIAVARSRASCLVKQKGILIMKYVTQVGKALELKYS